MEKFKIIPAGAVYANQLAPNLRPGDVLEIKRASGLNALDGLLESVALSDDDMCWAALFQGLPVAMFGANNLQPKDDDPAYAGLSLGGIWFLASEGIYLNKLDFMRTCKEYLAVMHKRYEFLTNFIDADNVASMTWLPRLGFVPGVHVADFGPEKLPFIQYLSKRT